MLYSMEELIILSKDWDSKPEGKPLGLIIKNLTGEQRHTGFIFPDATDNPVLAHFWWHKDFKIVHNIGNYAMHWLKFLPERTVIPIITELYRIHNINSLPYGIVNMGGITFRDGNMIPTSNNNGDSLTCSTFVLCILEQFAFPIIDRETWEITDNDMEWQKDILQNLESVLPKNIMDIQLNSIGRFPRISPEQIVGACAIFNYNPVSYEDACKAGALVINKLQELNC